MRKIFFIFLAAFLCATALGGCIQASYSREAEKLNGYLGGPISAMVQDLGAPSVSRQRSDGGWIYSWRACRVESGWGDRDWSRYCETTAVSDGEGIVRHWSWWGNECPLNSVSSGCFGLQWWQP
ncbi:exported hypothetical protein [uncultured delta proteobacterium]|uniref:Lipoprotein n=1 Tax=uncultured delta proteobacterium TaxID=34034 RepID=A0A212JPG0_9DELT|nr:exported hypothetical protein [uncultured delta proteobacterium]